MAETSTQRSKETIKRYGPSVAVYILATLFTDAFNLADSVGYAGSVVNSKLLELGHVLWRPLGWVLLKVFGPVTSLFVGPDPLANANLIFIVVNWMAGLLSVVMMFKLVMIITKRGWVANAVAIGLIFSQGFLNYAQSGTAYVPGLALLLLGLYIMVKGAEKPERAWRTALFAGLALAGAAGMWLQYVWSIPAALAAPLFLYGFNKQQFRLVFKGCVAFGLILILTFAAAGAAGGIYSISGFKDWVVSTSGYLTGLNGLPRVIFGLARSMINMGNDGPLFKAYLVEDPFNPVSMLDLLRVSLWKLALFYVFLAAILFNLLRSPQGRRVFGLFVLNATPVFAFALFWDGSAVERYLLLYPLIFIALAYSLSSIRSVRWLNYAALAFVAVAAVSNIAAMARPVQQQRQQDVVARISELEPRLRPESRVATVNQQDEVWAFSWTFPFHPINKSGVLKTYHIIEINTNQVPRWREEFAKETLNAWDQGGDMWLSERVFAARPQRDWNWVEGADQRISWTDIHSFFSHLELGERVGQSDGFGKLLPSEQNRAILIGLSEKP
ncbi:MAG TPA: hypothetical protein VKA70_12220 [Blastocatellia bacterium]|nr:hypothetical protein [Blastocatellia bacterium]